MFVNGPKQGVPEISGPCTLGDTFSRTCRRSKGANLLFILPHIFPFAMKT